MFENFINNKSLWYKTIDGTLFPKPFGFDYRKNEIKENKKFEIEEILKQFFVLGYTIARGIYDDRLIDIPLNPLFWDILLDKVN